MNILSRLAAVVSSQPKKLALVTERNQLNYEEILQLVQILDLELTTRGIRPGQTIVAALDRPELVIGLSFLVSLRGLTLIYSSPDVVTDNGVAFDAIVTVKDVAGPEGVPVIQITPDWFAPMGTLGRPDYSRAKGGGTFVFQSSGSTGLPKLIATSEADRLTEIDNQPILGGPDRYRRRVMCTLSPATSVALAVIQDALLHGGSIAQVGEDKERTLQYIDLWRVDTLLIAPAMAEKFLKMPSPGQYMTSLRRVMFMGANSTSALQQRFAALSGSELGFGYGSAEIGPICRGVMSPGGKPADSYVGDFMRDDLEVAFLDDAGKILPDATEGVLALRPRNGAPFVRRYLGDRAPDQNAGLKNGWFVTGDLMRKEGNALHFVGRAKNVINLGGRKVALEAIEAALAPYVPNRRVVALNDVDSSGQDRLAVVVDGKETPKLGAINLLLSQVLPGAQAVRCAAVATFPLTASGKIDRIALLQHLS